MRSRQDGLSRRRCVGQWTGDRGRTRPFRRHGRPRAGRAALRTRPADAQCRGDGRAPPGTAWPARALRGHPAHQPHIAVRGGPARPDHHLPAGDLRHLPHRAGGRRPRSAVPSSARSPAISAVTATGSANSAGKTRIRSARMPASAAGRVERNGQGARPWPCPRGHSAAGTSASPGRRPTGNPSRSATRVLARPRKEPPICT